MRPWRVSGEIWKGENHELDEQQHNARLRITLVDRSQDAGFEVTREMTAHANKRGAFTVSSSGWRPRVVEITATDISRGITARDVLENSDCPW